MNIKITGNCMMWLVLCSSTLFFVVSNVAAFEQFDDTYAYNHAVDDSMISNNYTESFKKHLKDDLTGDESLIYAGYNKAKQRTIEMFEKVLEAIHSNTPRGSGCSCANNKCQCCVHYKADVCISVAYLPDSYGIEVDVIVNGRVVFSREISAKNPPPLCLGLPYVERFLSLCIEFYDLDIASHQFTGCVKVEFRLEKVKVFDKDLGCFKLPIAWRHGHIDNTFDEIFEK